MRAGGTYLAPEVVRQAIKRIRLVVSADQGIACLRRVFTTFFDSWRQPAYLWRSSEFEREGMSETPFSPPPILQSPRLGHDPNPSGAGRTEPRIGSATFSAIGWES